MKKISALAPCGQVPRRGIADLPPVLFLIGDGRGNVLGETHGLAPESGILAFRSAEAAEEFRTAKNHSAAMIETFDREKFLQVFGKRFSWVKINPETENLRIGLG